MKWFTAEITPTQKLKVLPYALVGVIVSFLLGYFSHLWM